MLLLVLVGAAMLCCTVLLLFGCVCHWFKRTDGFSSFEDDAEAGRGVSIYPANESSADMSVVSFEPLPDILAKTMGSRALRPRITCMDKEKQIGAAKLVTLHRPFPRNQLLYVKEMGLGWFGQVLQGDADQIEDTARHSKVVVKILKDDASLVEKRLFLDEVAPYRELDHPNIVKLHGQCTETLPFLAILELPALGDLKSYFLSQHGGPVIQFAIDAAVGLATLHKFGYVHHDFAARNCLVTSDLRLKIGDYGIGEDMFREDYYDTGCDLLPVRWMSPESLTLKDSVWQLTAFTFHSNVWSLSVLLWEILAQGRKPYGGMRDEDVLQKVVRDGNTKLPPPSTTIPLHDRWYEVMEMCWQEVDDRPTADDILSFLQQIEEEASSQARSAGRQSEADSTGAGPASHTDAGVVSSQTDTVAMNKVNQVNHHVTEVLVHRVDDDNKNAFEDDFSEKVKVRKNKNSGGFEDDFIHGAMLDDNLGAELSQNDSILAYGGNDMENSDSPKPDTFIQNMSQGANLLVTEPVPVGMSTPSKPSQQVHVPEVRENQSDTYHTALSNQSTDSAADNSTAIASTNSNDNQSPQEMFQSDSTDNQNADEGYRTDTTSVPDILVTSNRSQCLDSGNDDSVFDNGVDKPQQTDLETEIAKEIYMTKGAALPPSSIHKSRSLSTIPEDGIPSETMSPAGMDFGDQVMTFEWDDYIGEELVGRVRYMSDESPRQVEEFTEWPFEQDSASESSNSKPGSVASEVSDAEVTRPTASSIDTRAYIANILTNRLNSLVKKTNTYSHQDQNRFYSFSQYDNDLDSLEHASGDMDYNDNASNSVDYHVEHAPTDPASRTTLSMPGGVEASHDNGGNRSSPALDGHSQEEQDDQLIADVQDAQTYASLDGTDDQLIADVQDAQTYASLDGTEATTNIPDVVVSEPRDHMLTAATQSHTVA